MTKNFNEVYVMTDKERAEHVLVLMHAEAAMEKAVDSMFHIASEAFADGCRSLGYTTNQRRKALMEAAGAIRNQINFLSGRSVEKKSA